jgi:hypothetical protein
MRDGRVAHSFFSRNKIKQTKKKKTGIQDGKVARIMPKKNKPTIIASLQRMFSLLALILRPRRRNFSLFTIFFFFFFFFSYFSVCDSDSCHTTQKG